MKKGYPKCLYNQDKSKWKTVYDDNEEKKAAPEFRPVGFDWNNEHTEPPKPIENKFETIFIQTKLEKKEELNPKLGKPVLNDKKLKKG